MNLDLIVKLVKLANNNPNDNEANLAARKVCKLIEEGKFIFGGKAYSTEKANLRGSWDKKPTGDPLADFFRQAQRQARADEQERKAQTEYARRHAEQEKEKYWDYGAGDWDYDAFDGRGPAGSYKTKKKKTYKPNENLPKRDRTCTRCCGVFKTAYVGNLFVCNNCYYKEGTGKK